MTDEWAIRDAATDLLNLYHGLDELKFLDQQPRGERTMRPAPGSRMPTPAHLLSLDVEMSARLFEIVRDAANYIEPRRIFNKLGTDLCKWIRFNSAAISELDFADDFYDELHDQQRRLSRVVSPLDAAEVAKLPEPYQIPAVICQRLGSLGRTMSVDALRKHVSRSQGTAFAIETKIRFDGAKSHRMSEVLAWLDRNGKPKVKVDSAVCTN